MHSLSFLSMKLHAHEILSSIAVEAGERIVDELGREVVRSIFVTGSLPRGEIAWFETGGKLEIYSDVDISVVVADDAAWEDARHRARRAVRDIGCKGEGYEWMRNADVGVYVLADLLAQPARPGTVDAFRCHQLLYGDAEIPKMMERVAAKPIDRTEGLYLLENRMIEKADLFERIHSGAGEGLANSSGLRRYAIYAAHKTCVDAGTAALIVAASYSSDVDERRRALRGISGDTVGERLLSGRDFDRIDGSLRALAGFQREMEEEKRSFDEVWSGVESFIPELWSRLLARLLAVEGYPGWIYLVSKRCRRGDRAANMRSFSALAGRRGFGKARALIMGAVHSTYSPVEALRCSGLIQCVMDDPNASEDVRGLNEQFVPYLDCVTRIFGHADGDVFTRARRLYREIN
jgi:hypothetical protein